ncbi:methyltransferase [Mycobacteroides chelonae]|uniref:class I SAM-dependent methyltransferase n=1 Tax=Mycobacteroides TaxID=670516 RepID=UPI0007A0FC03|nr:class I SAM-dependent methyltransferase [Mycobacteroides chelonae]AMW17998.1 methyltransferase [Mycobacterium sp. QIA-37]PKQ56684.1 SAM-dependent methyltransferase [Mycobacterium sp. MHSD3]SKM93175.1 methylase involved in ubiquinone/menaquinone biosynthesis [Mycobacteroides abscessus subsp. bolletii]AYM40398.1 class I SAM-dependent methyltransferase [[Mycobacterium] chelonae subsp. gwanakae]MBF9519570.1 methyltransferase domain-containing protein [Mycobacteroides chelonae]
MADRETLPLAGRRDEDLPGHWLLARLGKRVLRPGGLELTTRLLAAGKVTDADVVELGPGLGRTARDIVALRPRSYVGVDDTAAATQSVRDVVAPCGGRVIVADAASTGLPDGSADVVVGEAMLTMQNDKAKRAIVDEAYRVLRPGGRYAIHELGLTPDSVDTATKDEIRRALARSIKVNARPLTVAEWSELLKASGFEVVSTDRAPMALLNPRRVIADEGVFGALRLLKNVLLHGAARKRVLTMRRTFREHSDAMTAVALVGVRPE